MDEPLIDAAPAVVLPAVEIPPPAMPPEWRKHPQYLRAIPVCRGCAVQNKLTELHALTVNFECQMVKCEHMAAYLVIM